MSVRERKKLDRDNGYLVFPDPVPTDVEDLLDLMDDAGDAAGGGQAGSEKFEHGMRVFKQLHAHFQIRSSRELAQAHHELRVATKALSVATWWLAAVTIALGLLEVVKMARGH